MIGSTSSRNASGIGGNPLYKENTSDTLPAIIKLLLCLSLICSSALIPIFLGAYTAAFTLSLIVCVLSAAIVIVSAKKVSHSVIFIIAFVFSVMYFASPVIPAIVIGTVISIGAGSALLCSTKGADALCYIIAFPLAYGISFLATEDLILSSASFILLLPTLSMGLSAKLGGGRTLSLSLCALSEALLIFGGFTLWVFNMYGTVSLDAFDKASTEMVNGFVYYTELAFRTMSPDSVTNAMRSEIKEISAMTVNILPGAIGCACVIAAFLSHSVHMGLLSAYGIERYVTRKAITLTVSMEAALIFGLAYLLTFATDSSNKTSFAATVALNICLILAPCLIHVGIGILLSLPKKLGIFGLILWAVILVVLMNIQSSPLTIIALIGAVAVIITGIDKWAKDFYSKGDR